MWYAGDFPWAPKSDDYDCVGDDEQTSTHTLQPDSADLTKPTPSSRATNSESVWELGDEKPMASNNGAGSGDQRGRGTQGGNTNLTPVNRSLRYTREQENVTTNGPPIGARSEIRHTENNDVKDGQAKGGEKSDAALHEMDVLMAETVGSVNAKYQGARQHLTQQVCF